jgi:hypothetical protein
VTYLLPDERSTVPGLHPGTRRAWQSGLPSVQPPVPRGKVVRDGSIGIQQHSCRHVELRAPAPGTGYFTEAQFFGVADYSSEKH